MLLYFDDIVGKDLGGQLITGLLFYFAVCMIPVALPLAILISCLLAFGNLAEHYELTAIKSAGISLLRTIRPVFAVTLLLTAAACYINNNLVPKAALEAFSLMYDIKQKKPTLELREGTFYDGIPGISLRVNKKFPDGVTLGDIVLYDHRNDDGNREVIMADSGRMSTMLNEQYLKFEIFTGYRYSENIPGETAEQGKKAPGTETLTRSKFDRYQVVLDLSSFRLTSTPREAFEGHRMMRNLRELEADIASLKRNAVEIKLNQRRSAQALFNFTSEGAAVIPAPDHSYNGLAYVGIPAAGPGAPAERIDSLFTAPPSREILQAATNAARHGKSLVVSSHAASANLREEVVVFELQWHKILATSFMCVAMFIIGAPLGAIIKRGGIGIPFLVSMVFFLLYYVLGMQGEKLALQGLLSPAAGVWSVPALFACVGMILLRQARSDTRLFDGGYAACLKCVRHLWQRGAKRRTLFRRLVGGK